MERLLRILKATLLATLLGCHAKEPEAPPAPSGNGSVAASPRLVVLEGTLTRHSDGSETIVTDEGYGYPLRRLPGCDDIDTREQRRQRAEVIQSDCLEYAMARLLVAQALKEKPNVDNATLCQWLRTPGGHMTSEFQKWPDQDVSTMIEICRRVGRSKFISGDFPRPPRRKAVRTRGLERRYQFRGTYRDRVFEARSITRV